MTASTIDGTPARERRPDQSLSLGNPLDFIAEAHLSMRVKCAELDQIATTLTPGETMVSDMLGYLKDDLSWLLADEDETLLPLVMARAEPEDDMPALIDRLDREHQGILTLLAQVVAGLERVCVTGILTWDLRDDLKTLAQATRRHLILENAVLMPIARTRLTRADLDRLRISMLHRRGWHAVLNR